MFSELTAWHWVIIAWLEVIVAYGGYLFYLRRRVKRLKELAGADGQEPPEGAYG